MSTPVVGQLYFLEKREARLASCAWVSGLSRRGPGDGAARAREPSELDGKRSTARFSLVTPAGTLRGPVRSKGLVWRLLSYGKPDISAAEATRAGREEIECSTVPG